jgi:pimeloyl-ACP methyl ester carboxylesterase
MPYFVLPDAAIYYELTGASRTALVFIHGGGCDHRDWRVQVEQLGADFTVMALDLRGHGRSTGAIADCTVERWAADVNALIEVLGIGPAVIIGHSLASRVAAEAAWQQPANAAALVLLDGSRSVGGFAASTPLADAPAAVGDGSRAAIIDATVGPYADDTTRCHVMKTMLAAPLDVLQQTVAAYTDWDRARADIVFAQLPANLPVLAVQSTYHDSFTPRRSLSSGDTTPYLEFLKRALPQLDITVLPQTGHFAMMEKSGEVNALIRAIAVRTSENTEREKQ